MALLCVILLVPLGLVDVPPLLDYPNHLARAAVLAFGRDDPILSHMYAAHWTIIPNLGTDVVLPPLLHVLPIHLAGRIVLGITILLPVIGTIAYSRATFGTASAWPLASGLVAYNGAILLGFMNFVAAIGIALLLAAGWIAWRDRYPLRTVAFASVGTVVLFFCHLMGLVFFYALIAGYELAQFWSQRTGLAAIRARVLALLPLFGVPFGLYRISPLAPLPAETEFASIAEKARELIFPFANYLLPLDIVAAGTGVAFLITCIATRRCRITPSAGLALLLVGVLDLATPWAFKGTFFLDTRFAIMLGFLLFGAVLPAPLPRAAMLVVVTVFTLLFAGRMAVVALAWHGHRHDIADLRTVTASVEPGARVFVAAVSPEEAPDYWRNGPLSRMLSNGIRLDYHLPALLLIEHRAFWPFLFDNPSQQPVKTLQPYRELAERAGSIADRGALAVPGKADLCGFDYLLLLEAGAETDLTHLDTDRLLLLAQSDMAALFRVRPAACSLLSHSADR
ncbi:MAG TPA: hypothetical protein VKI44_33415 [Acetobacteraceae bacterium]|nr:hypothetical protein [Acetobacteraceae bacterium]